MNGRGEQRNRRAAHSEYVPACCRRPARLVSAALREKRRERQSIDTLGQCRRHAEVAAQADLVAPWVAPWTTGISPRRETLVPPRDSVRNMSQQNVAVARRWVELFNARDGVDEFLSLHDPEVVLQTPGGPRLHGHDQLRDWFEAGYQNVRPRILPERFVAGGDTVVGLGRTNSDGSNRVKSLERSRARVPTGFATARSSMAGRLSSCAAALDGTGC